MQFVKYVKFVFSKLPPRFSKTGGGRLGEEAPTTRCKIMPSRKCGAANINVVAA